MPTAQILVRQANGQQIVLSGDDRIVKEITVECQSPRCPTRHGSEKPVEFTFNDQDPFPAAGDSFMSLILPERSPSNPGFPMPFCSGQCLKDYLQYKYLAPGPRSNITEEQLAGLNSKEFEAGGPPNVRKTDNAEYHVNSVPATLPPNSGEVLKVVEPLAQADGAGE